MSEYDSHLKSRAAKSRVRPVRSRENRKHTPCGSLDRNLFVAHLDSLRLHSLTAPDRTSGTHTYPARESMGHRPNEHVARVIQCICAHLHPICPLADRLESRHADDP